MPELPEVEVITRGLRPLLIGRTITSVWYSRKNLRLPVPLEELKNQSKYQLITAVTRRAKFIQIIFGSGSYLIIHLGMTGQMGIFPPGTKRKKHDHLEWILNDGSLLRYNDCRRFGSVSMLSREQASLIEKTLYRTTGPEPFDDEFCADYLFQLAKSRNISVKQFLMTNQVVAGVGNIYANESLFRAGIKPSAKARSLSRKKWAYLIESTRAILNHAILCGGSTISDFVNAGQEKGYFQMNFMVYGRAGQKCRTCNSLIRKEVLGGRASFYCSKCQR